MTCVRGRQLKMLGAGSVVLFLGLGAYLTLVDAGLSASAIKLTVDTGVLAIALVSLAIRHPFTLQYAREVVDAETAVLPGFIKANYIITWAWTACMLLMMIGNILMIYLPGLPLWSDLRSPLPPATPRSISPNGIRIIARPNSGRRQAPPGRCPVPDTSTRTD